MPEKTLRAFVDHGRAGDLLDGSGGGAEAILRGFAQEGVDVESLGTELQRQGAEAFAASWQQLLRCIATRSEGVTVGGTRSSAP